MRHTVVNKEDAKQQIKKLIDKYNKIVEEGRIGKYSEEDTKAEFIEPFFEALGWDVRNRTHIDEVTREERVSKGRVDYGFRINGIPKFFLEAKPLKADLDKPEFAEQAINYAWHKGCTWAILTDFENIKVFNAEWKTTDLMQSRFISLEYDKFLERFNRLWLLSKEGFEQGVLDKEAEDYGKKSKKSPVGEQLFSDLTKWRSELSRDISQRNKSIKEEDLDEAVQRIIDRLIFIRNCEDRELEPPTLLSTVREWESKHKGSLAENIVRVFRHFDDEYNSKLFQHHLCDDLDVSNPVLEGIIEDLYHTKDRTIKYDFAVLDADVLGNVYEQYLGHILKKTAKRATLEEKHAYRKEQGIYYTPTYIVDYIVRNTLGELLKDKKVDLEKIRVLDPACGSGSFLIKAFDVLNKFYSKKSAYAQTQLDLDTGLPFKQKERVLLNNIFGVDLDTRAVEIAQLNLLLKLSEKKQRLPLLQENIKCGNSLIDDEKIAGDKAFKWGQRFKQIMDEGGFDVVIGNPPYVKESVNRKIFEDVKKGSSTVSRYYEGKMDYLYFFIELGIELLKEGGYLSFITTNYWLQAEGAKKLREKILKETTVLSVFNFNEFTVFEGTGQHNLVFILQKKKNVNNKIKASIIKESNISKSQVISAMRGEVVREKIDRFVSQSQNEFLQNVDFKISFTSEKIEKICQKIKVQQSYSFTENDIYSGIDVLQEKVSSRQLSKLQNKEIGAGIFVLSEAEVKRLELNNKEMELIKPYYTAKEIYRYSVKKDENEWIIYTKSDINNHIDDYPKIKKHLDQYKQVITSAFGPYGLHRARNEDFFIGEKILCVRKTKRPSFSYVNFPSYVSRMFISIKPKENVNLKVLMGILNSKLIHFWLYFKGKKEGNQLQVDMNPILEIPIKIPSESMQSSFVALVDKALSLNNQLNKVGDKKTDERYRLEEDIKKTDAEIDELVYKLYGITEPEKKIIEESLK
jgi:hypothetical protein